ncbi:hypothetical protein ECE50_027705 [Chitinophaga sp. Mgbs1]|uniref:Uncharacterized protein n=1 Tax=Chitinophaga solisilvae TaxID=1233460 RepID=A0A3S1CWD6_9BACT|nr:hypothetical protein [Chitinophaga solisilvae]
MIAYNRQSLDNLEIRQEANEAFKQGCISEDMQRAIHEAYPVKLYMPNLMISIGLFILTCIVIILSLCFFGLLNLEMFGDNFHILGIVWGLLCYGACELSVRGSRQCFHCGIDDALLYGAIIFIHGGLTLKSDPSMTVHSAIALLLTLLATLRFANAFCAGVAYLALLMLIFNLSTGPVAMAVLPFLIMLISGGVYLAVRKWKTRHSFRYYRNCLTVVEVLSLITLYAAGNYYIVRELSITMFEMELAPGQDIPFGWLFWILTVTIPLLYLYYGIRKKDVIRLRTGLLLVAAIVFTVRYYHHLLPLETAMVAAGILLIGGAWLLIRYLQTPRNGFTYKETDQQALMDKLQVESLIISETLTPSAPQQGMEFGGGTGGGGGASGQY